MAPYIHDDVCVIRSELASVTSYEYLHISDPLAYRMSENSLDTMLRQRHSEYFEVNYHKHNMFTSYYIEANFSVPTDVDSTIISN